MSMFSRQRCQPKLAKLHVFVGKPFLKKFLACPQKAMCVEILDTATCNYK